MVKLLTRNTDPEKYVENSNSELNVKVENNLYSLTIKKGTFFDDNLAEVIPVYQETYKKFLNIETVNEGFDGLENIFSLMTSFEDDDAIRFLRKFNKRENLVEIYDLGSRLLMKTDKDHLYGYLAHAQMGSFAAPGPVPKYFEDEFTQQINNAYWEGHFNAQKLKVGILNYIIHAPLGLQFGFYETPPGMEKELNLDYKDL